MAETNSDIQKFVEDIIEKAFGKVQKAYDNHKEFDAKNTSVPYEGTSVVFPMYGEHIANINSKTRISEQELRFAFVEAFKEENKDNKYYFSVETPTNSKYLFKGKNTPRIIPKNKKGGQSGQFDLVIHDENLKRICLIEFKANYPSERSFQKDFLKLANKNEYKDDSSVLRYFIHMVVNYNESKIKDIIKAARKVLEKAKQDKNEIETVNYVLFSLNESDNKIIEQDISMHNKISTNIQLQEKT